MQQMSEICQSQRRSLKRRMEPPLWRNIQSRSQVLSQLQLIVGQFIWIGDKNEPFPIEIGPHFEEEKSRL